MVGLNQKIQENQNKHRERIRIEESKDDFTFTFENMSYDNYRVVIHRTFKIDYLERLLKLVKKDYFRNKRDYNIFIERFNAYRALTFHNGEIYLVREGLNYYWKGLDSKNVAISMYRLQNHDFYGIKVIEKFRDLPPYIESLNQSV